jgi:micrococcal nuclease
MRVFVFATLTAAIAAAPALAATSGIPAPKAIAACAPGKAPVATVAAVIDGATLTLSDGRTVTLAGVDAPLAPLAAPDRPAPLADAAKAALAARAMAGGVKVAVVGDKPDRYGRLRANVFNADGQPLAAALVAAGYARVHRLPGDPECVLALLDGERQARIARAGMWADPDYRIRSATDPALADDTGLYELVAGRVISVGSGDVITFINFGSDYDHDFTVLVAPAVAKNLAAEGLDLTALADKRVVVRGMIEASGGPAVRLGDATDIEVLGDEQE